MFPRRIFKDHFHVSALVLLTIIGGVLRFSWIDRPAIWGDESATLGRVCGSYQDLLDRLQFDGFGPLHYEAYWWIANGFPYKFETKTEPVRLINLPSRRRADTKPTTQPTEKKWLYPTKSLTAPVEMTPFVMRFIPAAAGTLMIPAMYFLAVQLANRRVAIIAATITTFSAYMLTYSRDAKMYMHLWLAMTMSVACMLWWMRCAKVQHGGEPGLRAYRRIAWLGWLASSVAMVGLHATGLAILGLELVFLVTHLSLHPRQWVRAFTGLAVLGIAASGFLVHWLTFSRLLDRVERNGMWEVGIFWVDDYNKERGGPDLLKFTASAFAMSWEWPPPSQVENIPIRTYKALTISCFALLAIAGAGLIPWRRWRSVHAPAYLRPDVQMPLPQIESHSVLETASSSLTPRPVLPYESNALVPPRALSQVHLWLTSGGFPPMKMFFVFLWLIVPAYAMYCKSIEQFLTPWQVVKECARAIWDQPHSIRWMMVSVAGVSIVWSIFTFKSFKHWLARMIAIVLMALVIFGLCKVIHIVLFAKYTQAIADNQGWPSVWMPRYVGYLWPPFMALAAVLLSRLPTRPVRGLAIAFFVGINLMNYAWRLIESEPPTDKIAMDVLASQSNDAPVRTYAQVRAREPGAPGGGGLNSPAWRYFMIVYGKVKANPLEMRMFGAPSIENKIFIRQNVSPQFIVNDLKKSPQVNRVVVWDKVPAGWADPNSEDRLRKALGSGWRKTDEQSFTVWDHWTWQEYYTARRREYLRLSLATPTTQPATVSSAQ